MIAAGEDLDNAMWASVELETLSPQYYQAKLAGDMKVLSDEEMAVVAEKFKDYGLKDKYPR